MRSLVLCTALIGLGASLGEAACQPSPAVTVVHVGRGEGADAVRGDVIKTRRTSQEAVVGLGGGYYVIRGAEDWRNAWSTGKEPPLPATLDSARSMLLVAVAENKETVDVKIGRVLETGDRIHVWVTETRAGENCITKTTRTPSDAVLTRRVDKPVKFYVEDERARSCGEAPAVAVNCRANDAPKWTPTVVAQPGDTIECEMRAQSQGTFALVDNVLSLRDLPGGSSTKLVYSKGPTRGSFPIDVFGKYTVHAEANDESGRKSVATATIDVSPPKSKDVLVQLVWTNFDVSDDPDTFPRVELRALEQGLDARKKPVQLECSLDNPRPELCTVTKRGAYTHMVLKASDKRVSLDVGYVDERVDKGPLVCVQLYFDGVRTGETCDRERRAADEHWPIGTIDMATGKLVQQLAADGGAPDGGAAEAGVVKPLPPRIPKPKPGPPKPRAPKQLAPHK